jgi:hypothetical protein
MKKEKMMMNQTMNKQMTEFTRTTMDNTTKALAALQEQTEKMTNMFIDMLPWIPEEGKKALREWDKTYRKGLEDITAAVNESYKKVEGLFAGSYETLPADISTATAK